MAAAPPPSRPQRPGAPRTKFVPHSIEDQVRLAYSTPTSHVYRPTDPRHPDIAEPKPHGKISASKNISTLDYVSKHKSFVPGPTYVPPPWAKMGKPFCPEGGRFMLEAHKPPSYFDVAPKLYDANPPPGSYDARGSVEVKVVGELVYRYESATSSETKALIAKVVGDPEEVPGPGHYTLPHCLTHFHWQLLLL